ncbi:double-stranded RNA binding motif domain-containing protein [Streptomyces parvus]|uniref:double-stranded RNA binding motif domain-containing protein n=1 Tax=Streptomyces parvus TaxID=66428 RepID=UPI0036672163
MHEQRSGPACLPSPHLVTMIASLGGAWLDVWMLERLVADPSITDSGTQSARLAQQRAEVQAALGRWVVEHEFVHLGRGQAASSSAGVQESMGLQLLGALALVDAHAALHALVADVMREATFTGGPEVDRATLLQQQPYGESGVERTWGSEGPDHEIRFTCTVRTHDGRTASGTGHSKKTSRQAAARRLMQDDDADLVRRVEAQAVPRPAPCETPRRYEISESGHRRVVERLRNLFALPEAAGPWLAQSFTHKSWAYENRQQVTAARQASNARLAHFGSHVARVLMAYERVRETAARGLRPAASDARIGSVGNGEIQRLGAVLSLGAGMLIGKGESQNSTVDHSVGAAQAVLAVAWKYLGTGLLTSRPRLLKDWLTTIGHGLDPATQLEQFRRRYDIRVAREWFVRGPDHAEERLCELTLDFRIPPVAADQGVSTVPRVSPPMVFGRSVHRATEHAASHRLAVPRRQSSMTSQKSRGHDMVIGSKE